MKQIIQGVKIGVDSLVMLFLSLVLLSISALYWVIGGKTKKPDRDEM